MNKTDVKDFASLETYARDRAKRSSYRNDPVAVAYWLETARWAVCNQPGYVGPFPEPLFGKLIRDRIALYAEMARAEARRGAYMPAALAYSRAKWCMFMERNNGRPVSPKRAGMGLDWLRQMVGF